MTNFEVLRGEGEKLDGTHKLKTIVEIDRIHSNCLFVSSSFCCCLIIRRSLHGSQHVCLLRPGNQI